MKRLIASGAAGFLLSLFVAVAVFAVDGGVTNGLDSNGPGWTGDDNPNDDQGTYSIDNGWQDFYLSEWLEPNDDWTRERFIRWSAAAENKLDNESATHFLTMELRVHDQFYYNHGCCFASDLPFTAAPEAECCAEELLQGYTEIDMEFRDQARIVEAKNYKWDTRMNSEKKAIPGWPDFYSEVEYSPKAQPWVVNFDVTGWFEKKVDQQ